MRRKKTTTRPSRKSLPTSFDEKQTPSKPLSFSRSTVILHVSVFFSWANERKIPENEDGLHEFPWMCHLIWGELRFSHGSAGNGRHSQCGLRGGQDRASCGPHEPGEPDRCFQLGCRISDPQSALVSNQLLPSPPFPLSLLLRPSACKSVCDRPLHFPSPLFRCPPPTSCLTSSILAALRAALILVGGLRPPTPALFW